MTFVGMLTAAVVLSAATAEPGSKEPKLKPSVTYAKSWDAAVAEARLLGLPLMVHSHGFY